MQHTSRKSFGPIRDAYAFFQQHATETEADIRAYLPHLLVVATGDQPIRMLDFGCGDGAFTAALLAHAPWSPARLQLALVEPDDVYRQQAVARLQAYTTRPVRAWAALPAHLRSCVDLVLANHVLYFVPDLDSKPESMLKSGDTQLSPMLY
jgi:trans-aconitate methyltransferase